MTRPTQVSRSSIAVVGAGAAGTLTAARLIEAAGRRHQALQVTLIDPRPQVGQGVAFGTDDNRHLLNVPVRKMSAYGQDPDHFARWLHARDGVPADPCGFVPRGRYGDYLRHVLAEAQRLTPWAELVVVHDVVEDIAMTDGQSPKAKLHLGCGAVVEADGVVLALGHLGTQLGWAPEALVGSSRFVADPWRSGALDAIDPDADVLVVGTGLTMVDVARVLDRGGRTIHAASRRGEVPKAHVAGQLPVMEAPEFASSTPTLAEIQDVMVQHVAKARARYGDWRPAVDSIRPLTQRLWAGLSDAERAEFVALDARAWDAARHRIPPASAAVVAARRADGHLVVHAARVLDATDSQDGLTVTLSDGAVLLVAAVVNCTGPCDRPYDSVDPLVRSLLDGGFARTGPLGIGFDTTPDGQLRGRTGTAERPIWTLGSLRRGTLWETTAIPEIRDQAASLPAAVLGGAPVEDDRPCDRYGLALSTTARAAAHWRAALDAVCALQHGAESHLRASVLADPGFALGHAALALLGHEWGWAVDVDGALAAAAGSVAFRGDPRERSFVQMVVSRLTDGEASGDRELTRHLHEHPRDAFAVSLALPTIAFSGLTQPVAESWALADRLAEVYGDDPWYAGMLAFVRQEQERWDEADTLARYALARQPGAGHAAHALAHVFYETGQHEAGLAWLDGWLGDHAGETSYPAHFSWHAALHELALDRGEAVERRYRSQLAPPVVDGPRVLVDSVSLVWRSRLVGVCTNDIDDQLLASVPGCLLDHPATSFAALHAVIGHALEGNRTGLGRLRAFAAGHHDPTYVEVVVPLCDGFLAYLDGDLADAAARLAQVVPEAARLGGSAAQQEVVAETMLDALIRSGQNGAARDLLAARLARRPRPSEVRRMATLQP